MDQPPPLLQKRLPDPPVFVKATKKKAKARVVLIGPSRSGKTYTALSIAQGLGTNIAVIDSEHGKAALYSRIFDFEHCELTSFSPRNYIAALAVAAQSGFDVVIIDSLSHEWAGPGGCLELANQVAENSRSGNSFAAWAKITPQHNEFIEAILAAPFHIIGTLRTKMDYASEKDDRGRTQIQKLGLAPIQRDGIEYEFDVVGNLDERHMMTVTARMPELEGRKIELPNSEFGAELRAWLETGVEAAARKPIRADVNAMVAAFAPIGVTQDALAKYCGRPIEDLTEADVTALRKIYIAITDKSITIESIFSPARPEPESEEEPKEESPEQEETQDTSVSTPSSPSPTSTSPPASAAGKPKRRKEVF